MNVKEEIAKLTGGQIITGIIALIASLSLIVLQGTLWLIWKRVEPEIEKRTLAAAVALELIAITILVVIIGALLFRVFRKPPALPVEREMLLQYGLRWDRNQNPHCPVETKPLFVLEQRDDPEHGFHDKLKCPDCKATFPIRDEHIGLMTLAQAKHAIRVGLQTGRISD